VIWDIVITQSHYEALMSHLFPGDYDEHGAVLSAGWSESPDGRRLLVRDVFLAEDGVDYIQGQRGHRLLKASFVNEKIRYCRQQGLAYLAVHNHGGSGSVAFSSVDLASHQRGYPALVDIAGGPAVGALVLADGAAAAQIWTPGQSPQPARSLRVVGDSIRTLRPEPLAVGVLDLGELDRQVRVLGEAGQAALREMTVGVIGAGGVGALVVQLLARSRVGTIVVVDPDRVEPTNLPRLPEATRRDAKTLVRRIPRVGPWLAERLSTPKTRLAKRIARRANPDCRVIEHRESVTKAEVQESLKTCDFLFLAADEHRARDTFNRLVHQYLIPGMQLGTKIAVKDGTVGDILVNVRKVTPQQGCLTCNQLVNYSNVQEESVPLSEREANRYLEDEPAPSVMSFNGIAASWAVSEFLVMTGGLALTPADGYAQFKPRERSLRVLRPRAGDHCLDCGRGPESVFARGQSSPRSA
jgi:hypothetical protein